MDKQSFFYAFKELVKDEKYHLLLESGRGGQQSVAGWNPMAVVRSTDDGLLISWRDGQEETRVGESLHLLEALIDEYKLPVNVDFPDFQGGAAGFISYDYARKIENLPNLAEDDLQIPDLYFYLFDEWAVYDVAEEQVHLMKLSSSDVDLAKRERDWQLAGEKGLKSQKFAEGAATDVVHDVTKLQVSLSADVFEEAVRKVQNYIAQGDVFQVNLSVRQAKELGAEPMQMYEALRSFNPSPYMAFIQSPEFAVVSGSPELLVKKKGQELSTRPIAGTRPRGKDIVEDERLAQELIDNEKERAEHVMLVDLERNDLGRVSKYGTVEVNEFMVIERYSHVMHIVSNVRGIVDENCSNADVVRALFPGGTITGAPKIRTMEIIEELETVRRGLYTGSIGWLGYNGDLELNIVIRTAFIKEEMAYIQAGAGIVIDSIPTNEYIESLNKAKALWQAKAMAEECNV
ncbi:MULTISPECIES: anthranilate synthase component I family protein [unclassified Viridibacillus]|uniref:anthranilate synthase component I family protein n=1 Tax=unclassified Viridibacillus TaxID=2617942 RepID=UPI00096FA790|nr:MULTISPECIES: anthranilate synthase component I family protein [unclassified Viridibacillus]OMC78378.1 aminodeoxychorismate synthase component I [Viridibacillus sp. FSL H8-0123]OMC81968.1 aminodeoxychorismate synthase component I [Viridibacillus sp. FSL H7-0596]